MLIIIDIGHVLIFFFSCIGAFFPSFQIVPVNFDETDCHLFLGWNFTGYVNN